MNYKAGKSSNNSSIQAGFHCKHGPHWKTTEPSTSKPSVVRAVEREICVERRYAPVPRRLSIAFIAAARLQRRGDAAGGAQVRRPPGHDGEGEPAVWLVACRAVAARAEDVRPADEAFFFAHNATADAAPQHGGVVWRGGTGGVKADRRLPA